MQYCKVVFKQIPIPVFAHTYENTRYDYVLLREENTLELGFIEQGAVDIYQKEQLVRSLPENSLNVICFQEDIRLRSEAPLHRHITVGLKMEYEMIPLSEAQVITCGTDTDSGVLYAILPWEKVLQLSNNGKIAGLIREIIQIYPNEAAGNRLIAVSKVMKLLYEITQECIRQSYLSQKIPAGHILYTQKVMRYISEHIREKMTVDEIAEVIERSPGYLSNVFKQVTGQTLIEYINRTKLNLVKELVLTGKMTYMQAGEYVGISDTCYLSRLFRKHFGLTIRELKSGQKTISEWVEAN